MHPYSINRCCAVCGDTPAKIHYGVLACFGCKGFFRRAVKDGRNKYVCRFEKNCEVTKYERNACRYCRFRKCLLVGMNPDYVRPDREKTKRSKSVLTKKKSVSRSASSRFLDASDWSSLLAPNNRKLLAELARLDHEVQQSKETNFEIVRDFSLRSLIADRSLARQNGSQVGNCPSNSSQNFLCIERIVEMIDYIEGIIRLLEDEYCRKFSVEDKFAVVSNSMIHLLLFESIARFVSKGENGFDDLKQSFNHLPIHTTAISHKLSDIFQSFLRKSPSIIEYSIVKAYIVTTTDSSVLSNSLNDVFVMTRENLSELLFKVIKNSRGKTSVYSANQLANIMHLIYETRSFATSIRHSLSPFYDRNSTDSTNIAFHKILVDIINPEISDLLITTAKCHKNAAIPIDQPTLFHFSPPPISPTQSTTIHPSIPQHHAVYASEMDYNPVMEDPKPASFIPSTSHDYPRPTSLSFPKIPLEMTKSIEEILRPPGMVDHANIMNRPLAKDWADGVRLTPVFNRDIVAQFFPELSANQF